MILINSPQSHLRKRAGLLGSAGLLAGMLLIQTPVRSEEHPLLKLQAVPFTRVEIKDAFWAPRQEVNRQVSIPHSLDMLEKYGNLRNFTLAAQGARKGFTGFVFADSDVYKTLEAASYALATNPDPALEKRVDAVIARLAAAQQPDGYLDTYYEIVEPGKRWTNLRDNHELYCAGHLFEAAVAHYEATGKRTLLAVATKYADCLAAHFGEGPGKRMGYGGHPEIELALVRLWRATGQQRYFDLARFFIEHRGSHFFAQEHETPLDRYDGTYWLDDVPIRDHKSIKGHAVRACYLMSGVVDVAGETEDAALLKMVGRVWRNTVERNLYVTGGIGPSGSNEGFTTDYDLPNLTAYQETCASVAMMLWNHRLNLLYGDARYADLVERTLYNGFLSGVSLDGKRFFYVNPLASQGRHHRAEWFACACCPPNVTRTLASLGSYAYATSGNGLWVNLYIQGGVHAAIAQQKLTLDVTTDYPWNGKVKFVVRPEKETHFSLNLRIPGWCSGATSRVNDAPVREAPIVRGYLALDRTWKPGDVVTLDLSMPARRIEANPQVKEDQGQAAIARGPIIYCLEGCDNGASLASVALPGDAALTVAKAPELPGVVALKGEGLAATETDWQGGLYRTAASPRKVTLTAVPYYAWDNRAPGEMRVWLPTAPPAPAPARGPERAARVSLSFVSGYCQPRGINDGIEPQSSSQQPTALCHWWPHKGGEEWAQYTWTKPITTSGAKVYWFDDTGRGECRPPVSWKILYRDGSDWKPVVLADAQAGYAVRKDQWCEVRFAPVTTTELRLVFEMQPNWSVGIHEWKVLEPEEDE
jgi:DUF1680 family protein